jgi:hypothetical protein
MIMNREQAIAVLQELPQEFNLEELMEKLIFIEKVEQGLKQLDEEKSVLHQNVKDIISVA